MQKQKFKESNTLLHTINLTDGVRVDKDACYQVNYESQT